MSGLPTLADLFDPRGRCSRAGLLAVAGVLLAADALVLALILFTGASLTGPAALAFKLGSVWVATAAVAQRLHDLDLSAWWIAKWLVAQIGWSIVVAALLLTRFNARDAMDPSHVAFWLNLVATSTPLLVALVWLHFARGTPGPNRFGAEPDGRGFGLAHRSGGGTGVLAAVPRSG